MLRAVNLSKEFGDIPALSGVSVDFGPGKVTCVIGENGAGKSTLMKLLSGVYRPSTGHIELDGEVINLSSPREAIALGIGMVHQELNLIPTLSVAANLFLGREPSVGGVVKRGEETLQAQLLLEAVGAKFSANRLCGTLSVAEQQLIEIAKAVATQPKFILFDEPTAVLSSVESEKLFSLIGELKRNKIGVIYISHRLPEVLQLADEIIVLRDGSRVADTTPDLANETQLATLMVGRELTHIYPPLSTPAEQVVFEAEVFSIAGIHPATNSEALPMLSLKVRGGEIVGLGGLVGSGRTEFSEALVGLRRAVMKMSVNGRPVTIRNYPSALDAGLAYVSEDRKGKGLNLSMSIRDNIGLASLGSLSTVQKRDAVANHWINELGIKTSATTLEAGRLSGGNQQKVSLAKWLQRAPKLVIIDEPTRGVDVGAKAEIYRVIAALAEKGMGCILISSEMPELIGLCHRVIVMRDQRAGGELAGDALSETNMMKIAAGVSTT